MLKFFRKGRKSLSRLSLFQRFRKQPSTDSELMFTQWNLPLPPDIMNHIIDTYNDIPVDVPTILALAQSYPVLRPFCFSKIFQNLDISTGSLLTFEFFADVIQKYPFVLERMESLTLEGQFKRKELTGSSYVLSQITERSQNLGRLCLSMNNRWEECNETFREHLVVLLSQSRLHTFVLWPYGVPIDLLRHLPDLKRLEITPFFQLTPSGSDTIPVWARRVKVEELVLIGINTFCSPLDFSSLFDFSDLKVLEVREPWIVHVQEILAISAASLRKLELYLYDALDVDLGILSCLEHITLSVRFECFTQTHHANGDVSRTYDPPPSAQLQLISRTLATCQPHNNIEKIHLSIHSYYIEDLPGPSDWLSLDSLFWWPGTWKALDQVSLVTVPNNTKTPEILEWAAPIELPCLMGRGVMVKW